MPGELHTFLMSLIYNAIIATTGLYPPPYLAGSAIFIILKTVFLGPCITGTAF